jgi:predicted branched-subunit amino acid permease
MASAGSFPDPEDWGMRFSYALSVLFVLITFAVAAAESNRIWILLLGMAALVAVVVADSRDRPS